MSGSSGSSSTIKEFLVALGFKVDEAGLRKFGQGIVTATKQVVGIGAALMAAQGALIEFTKAAAEQFEELYYTAQRSGTTVSNLRALQYAFNQTGMSGSSAAALLDRFAMSLRMNPAMEGLLKGFGIATRTIDGKMRDTGEILHDFVGKLRTMPPWLAAKWAELFGVDPQTLYMMEQGYEAQTKAAARFKELQRLMHVDSDGMGERSKEFMNSLRELGTTIELMWDRVADKLMTRLGPAIKQAQAWIIEHQNDILAFETKVFKAFDAFTDDMKVLWGDIDTLVTKTMGWKTALEIVGSIILYKIFGPIGLAVAAWEKLHGFSEEENKRAGEEEERRRKTGERPRIGPDSDLGPGALWDDTKRLWNGITGLLHHSSYSTRQDGTQSLLDAVRSLPEKTASAFQSASLFTNASFTTGGGGPQIVNAAYHPDNAVQRWLGGGGGGGGGGAVGAPPSAEQNQRASNIIPQLMKSLGLQPHQAAGIAAMLSSESGLSEKTVASGGDYGLAQWIGSRKRELFAWAQQNGLDVKAYDTQYKFLINEMRTKYPELLDRLRRATNAQEAARTMAPYEAGSNQRLLNYHYGKDPSAAEAFLRYFLNHGGVLGGGGQGAPTDADGPGVGNHATIHQTNTFHINGARDPKAVGQEMAVRQRGVNSDIMRNLSAAGLYV